MSDLVWSDPNTDSDTVMIQDSLDGFAVSPRGAGYLFGKQVTEEFLNRNDLGHICRAHQLCMEGYQVGKL
jgi:serine/threonine-protein phosphatase PPG1